MESEEEILRKENDELNRSLQEAQDTLEAIRRGDIDAIVVNGPNGNQLYSLVSPEHPYQVFVEKMGEAALIISRDAKILYANATFYKMINHPSEEIIGSSLLNFIQEDQRLYFTDFIKKKGDKKGEFSFYSNSNKIITTSISLSTGIWEESENLCLLITDITSLKRAQRLIEASESITKILSEAPTLSKAVKSIIDTLNNYLGWELILVWVWNKDKQLLSCVESAHIEGINPAEFIKKSKEIGSGKKLMPSTVWSSYRPYWIGDVTEDRTFLRRDDAFKCDLHGALAFPYYEESQLSGVIELFRRTPFSEEVDDQLLNLVTSIGIEVGLFIKRKTVEETNFQFTTIVNYSVNGIYITDTKGTVISWNPSAEKIFGWNAHEIIGTSIKAIYPEDKYEEFTQIWDRLLAGTAIEHTEAQRVRKDGKVIWIESTYGATYDTFGKITGACFIVQDVSSQKILSASLLHSEDRWRSFIEITEEWIWEVDKEGVFLFTNPAVLTILGYLPEEVLGKSILYFLSSDEKEKVEAQFQANIIQKKGWVHQVMQFTHKNGSACWLESNASELMDKDRKLIGFRGASRNITEAKNLEKIKNEFISIVSHEIRTPLTSIQGALMLLKKGVEEKDSHELIDIAQRNSVRLSNIINDIMDVEKFKLGKFKYNFSKINLKDVVLESMRLSDALARKYGLTISAAPTLMDAYVHGDYQRLVQVMMNLLSNAIKFTRSNDTINVAMEIIDPSVRVSVTDHGPGIPKEFQPKIFEKFSQADSTTVRSFEGTGLGLNICKNIVQGHGGTIQFVTKEGEGTTFFFDLPQYKEGADV